MVAQVDRRVRVAADLVVLAVLDLNQLQGAVRDDRVVVEGHYGSGLRVTILFVIVRSSLRLVITI